MTKFGKTTFKNNTFFGERQKTPLRDSTPYGRAIPTRLRRGLPKAKKYSAQVKLGAVFFCSLAEREGFEPPEPLSSTVFKTAVIDHSTTSPNMQ